MARKSLKAEAVEINPVVVTTEEVEMKIIEDNQAEGSITESAPVTTTEEVEMNTASLQDESCVEQSEVSEAVVELIENTFTPDAQDEEENQGGKGLRFFAPSEFKEMSPEDEMTEEAWDDIQGRLDVLNVESIKLVIDYCKDKLQALQREEIEALEAQMRMIQSKLFSMKGMPTISASINSAPKRVAKPIVNPNNPSQIYTFGKHPTWLLALMESTGKTVDQLRNGN